MSKHNRTHTRRNAHRNRDVSQIVFQDALDNSHFLRVCQEKDRTVICRVFFGTKKQMSYFGMTEVPKSLFDFEGKSAYGFNALES